MYVTPATVPARKRLPCPTGASRFVIAFLLLLAAHPAGAGSTESLARKLISNASAADPKVLEMAARALSCGHEAGVSVHPATLSVIDYSRSSTQPRMWVFELEQGKLLFEERVAHGRNSGGDRATRFSNSPGSLMSSIGAFVTADTYEGRNGYSLRLHGLEPGFNDKAFERAIVIHGAPYVSEGLIQSQGRLGRSFGCPAVRPAIARSLIDSIRGGSFVFAYFPDRGWLERSQLLKGCDGSASPTLTQGRVH